MNEALLIEIKNELEEDYRLWDILTALRGPDFGEEEIKAATTCVLRHFFLGKPSSTVLHGSLVYRDSSHKVEVRRKLKEEYNSLGLGPSCGRHFLNHAQKAFTALGLDWNELNL